MLVPPQEIDLTFSKLVGWWLLWCQRSKSPQRNQFVCVPPSVCPLVTLCFCWSHLCCVENWLKMMFEDFSRIYWWEIQCGCLDRFKYMPPPPPAVTPSMGIYILLYNALITFKSSFSSLRSTFRNKNPWIHIKNIYLLPVYPTGCPFHTSKRSRTSTTLAACVN